MATEINFDPYLKLLKALYDPGMVEERYEPLLSKLTQQEIKRLTNVINIAITTLKNNKEYSLYGIIIHEFYFNPEVNYTHVNLSQYLFTERIIKRTVKEVMDLKAEAIEKLRSQSGNTIRKKLDSIILNYNPNLKNHLKHELNKVKYPVILP